MQKGGVAMANAADEKTLGLAIQERLGVDPGAFHNGGLGIGFDNGQRLSLRFSADGRTVTVTTPVDGAHESIPPAILRRLLARNAADGGLAGGSIRLRPGQDYLEIANVVPVELGALAIADIAINQSNAAAALVAEVRDAVAASLRAS